jgi:hypothetical protein
MRTSLSVAHGRVAPFITRALGGTIGVVHQTGSFMVKAPFSPGRHPRAALLAMLAGMALGGFVPAAATADQVTIKSVQWELHGIQPYCGRELEVLVEAEMSPNPVLPGDYATARVVGFSGEIATTAISGTSQAVFLLDIPIPDLDGTVQTLEVFVQHTGLDLGGAKQERVITFPGKAAFSASCWAAEAETPLSRSRWVLEALTAAATLACKLNPECGVPEAAREWLHIGSAMSFFTDALLHLVSEADPPDPDFEEVATPSAPTPPKLPLGLSAAQEAACAAFDSHLATTIATERALLTSADRAWGAYNAHDTAWFTKQREAEAAYVLDVAAELEELPGLTESVELTLGLSTLPGVVSEQAAAEAIQQVANGSDPEMTAVLGELGANPEEREQVEALAASGSPFPLVGEPLATVLTSQDAGYLEAAQDLREWAREISTPERSTPKESEGEANQEAKVRQEVEAKQKAESALAEIRRLLLAYLKPSGRAASIRALVKHGGVTVSFKESVAGSLSVGWYEVPSSAKLARARRPTPIRVAFGRATFSAAGVVNLEIALTPAGKKLLEHASKLKLQVKATFTPVGGAPVTAIKPFVLRG